MSECNLDWVPTRVLPSFHHKSQQQSRHMCWFTKWISLCSVVHQHGLGVLHLLHGRIGHHPQLLHEDRHRVQAQAQDLRAEHPGGARAGGFRIFPGTLRAFHLQIYGVLFQPDPEKRQENSHTCWLSGPEWHCSISRGRTVLNGTVGGGHFSQCGNLFDWSAVVHMWWVFSAGWTSLAPSDIF